MARAKEYPELDSAMPGALIGDAKSPEDFVGLMRSIQKRLAERMLAGELTAPLWAPIRSSSRFCMNRSRAEGSAGVLVFPTGTSPTTHATAQPPFPPCPLVV